MGWSGGAITLAVLSAGRRAPARSPWADVSLIRRSSDLAAGVTLVVGRAGAATVLRELPATSAGENFLAVIIVQTGADKVSRVFCPSGRWWPGARLSTTSAIQLAVSRWKWLRQSLLDRRFRRAAGVRAAYFL
jgi:hypothetical protein